MGRGVLGGGGAGCFGATSFASRLPPAPRLRFDPDFSTGSAAAFFALGSAETTDETRGRSCSFELAVCRSMTSDLSSDSEKKAESASATRSAHRSTGCARETVGL